MLDEICELFAAYPTILDEFVHFLPDDVQEQARERFQQRTESKTAAQNGPSDAPSDLVRAKGRSSDLEVDETPASDHDTVSSGSEPDRPWVMPDASWFEEGEPLGSIMLSKSWSGGTLDQSIVHQQRNIADDVDELHDASHSCDDDKKDETCSSEVALAVNDGACSFATGDMIIAPPRNNDLQQEDTDNGTCSLSDETSVDGCSIFDQNCGDDVVVLVWDAGGAMPQATSLFADARARGELHDDDDLEEEEDDDDNDDDGDQKGGGVKEARLRPLAVKRVLLEATDLPITTLRDVWELADVDQDGALNVEELALALHLCGVAEESGEKALPGRLPSRLVPPTFAACRLEKMRPTCSSRLYCIADGHWYGTAIVDWVKEYGTSPKSHVPVLLTELVAPEEVRLLMKPRTTQVLRALREQTRFDVAKAKFFLFTALQCKAAGYSVREMKVAGYHL